MSYTCSCCGQRHDDLPDLAFGRPTYAHQIPPDEQDERIQLDSDLCVVDDEHYFIRGVIEIPIRGSEHRYFGIGARVCPRSILFRGEKPHIPETSRRMTNT